MIPRAFGEVPMDGGPTVYDQVARWKGRILDALAETGPRSVGELPRRWPMTRQVNRILVRDLVAEGLIDYVQDVSTGERFVRLTAAGRRGFEVLYIEPVDGSLAA